MRKRKDKKKRTRGLTSKIVGSYSLGNSPKLKTDNKEVLPQAPSPTITNLRRNYLLSSIRTFRGFRFRIQSERRGDSKRGTRRMREAGKQKKEEWVEEMR